MQDSTGPGTEGTQFTLTLVWRRTHRWVEVAGRAPRTQTALRQAAEELENALADHPDVTLRGAYSTAGLRPDSDLAFWLVGPDVSRLQAAAAALRRTSTGRACELSHAFLGVARPPEYVGDHWAAFQVGKPPLGYLCLYPFVRKPE